MTVDVLLTFRQYLARVVTDPKRADEMEILIDLFGMPYLERVIEGKANVEPKDFLGGRK